MKKNLSIFVFVLSTASIFAQINIGAKAGVNYAYFPNIEFSEDFNFTTQPILAYHIGAIAEFDLSKRFAISTEILYSIKGSEIDQLVIGVPTVQTFATSYISLPILGKVKLSKLGILGGIEPSVIASERVRFNNGSWQSAEGLFNTFDFSLIGGLDLRIKKLYFAARYIQGLRNALTVSFSDVNGQPLGNGTNPNRVFQFSAGYFFLN
ncbi:MAG: hypothetical protein ACI85O_001697 [Saprospiraceae bacterium]|jgi:hypothetical protein